MHPIGKPRVFLSHSKKDVDFIRRLEVDLRRCLIDPWIDEIEIRHGSPWLDQIFKHGIPSCEVVLCFISEHSIDSKFVQQEIDARLVERFQNDSVGLLIYVSKPELRRELRLDVQRLQLPELNAGNYADMLPRVVSEIWRSYSETIAANSIKSERVKRLEAELKIRELESKTSAALFSTSEDAEFSDIWSKINVSFDVLVSVSPKLRSRALKDGAGRQSHELLYAQPVYTFSISLRVDRGALYRTTIVSHAYSLDFYGMREKIGEDLLFELGMSQTDFYAEVPISDDLEREFLRFGFLERKVIERRESRDTMFAVFESPFRMVFTSKFDRFNFWLDKRVGFLDKTSSVLGERLWSRIPRPPNQM